MIIFLLFLTFSSEAPERDTFVDAADEEDTFALPFYSQVLMLKRKSVLEKFNSDRERITVRLYTLT